MKISFKIIFSIVTLTLIGSYFYLQHFKKSALPDYNKDITIKGLAKTVSVYRDKYGIPHIVAKNETDLYRVSGYVTAQDRLWQMDLLRRVTQGRLSEIFGEDLIDTDVVLRKLRIPDNSIKLLQKLNKNEKEALDAYADGINQYIETHKDNLPFEFRMLDYKPGKWKAEHSLNLVGYMAWMLEMGYKMEATLNSLQHQVSREKWQELLPDYQNLPTYAYPSFKRQQAVAVDTNLVAALNKLQQLVPDIFTGSNNWVIGGNKSTTGKPIFSNDMHLALNVPGVWSQMHQIVKGKLNVTGVILPGSPFIVAGHNEHIAWGMTNVMLDGSDFYIETIHPEHKDQYKFNGKWQQMEVRHEKIYVKDREKPVEKDLYFTHHGPIFTQIGAIDVPVVSMHWIGNEESREIEALYKLNRATNWQEFTEAIQGFQSVSQNIAYADTQGNFGIHMTGRIPVRKAPGYLFFPGDTDLYDWKEYVPFDKLPYEYNPERGYVSSANNKSVNDSILPYYITEWYDLPYRIKRIRQMIEAKEKLSMDDVQEMLYDHHSVAVDELKPKIVKYLKQDKNLTKNEQKALEILEKWDHRFEVNETAPYIYLQTLSNFVKNLTQDEMDTATFQSYYGSMLFSKYLVDRAFRNEKSAWCDNVKTPEKETFADMIRLSFKQTVSSIEKDYGGMKNIRWGAIHQLELQHPIGKVAIIDKLLGLNKHTEAPGSSNTVNPFSFTQGKSYNSDFGASEKHIFNMADFDHSRWIIPTGVSGIPGSKHYLDQTEMYVKGELHPNYISLEKVQENAVYTSRFLADN